MEKQENKEVRNGKDDGRDQKKRHRDRTRKNNQNHHTSMEIFRGKHKDLLGWVYTYDNAARAYQYSKTTEAIAEWVMTNLPYPLDIEQVITSLEEPVKDEWRPKKSTEEGVDEDEAKAIFNEEIKEYLKRKKQYDENKYKVFSIVLMQCSETLQAKLKGQDTWANVFKKKDLLNLMKNIKVWMLNQESSRNPTSSVVTSMIAFFRVRPVSYTHLTLPTILLV